MPNDRDPRHRPHARRQARRRPLLARGHRARRHRDQGRARARRRRAGAGPARRHGPGAPGRPGPDPLAPGPDQGRASRRRSPPRRSTRSAPRACAPSAILDPAIRAGDVEVAVGGGMESMSQRALPAAQGALRLPHGRRQGARRDGPRRPDATRSAASQMFEEATEVGDELEMTRADLDRWALRSHERAIAATDDGRLPEEIVSVTVKASKKGDTIVEVDEAPRRDTSLEALAKLPGLSSARRARTPPATRRASTTAPARSCSPPTSGRRPTARRSSPRSSPRRRSPTTSPTSPARPPTRRQGARQGRPAAGRHRPVGDQRGVRLGRR